MKTYYIAGFVPEEDGKYSVYFPDIPGCQTWGENLAHATENAADALRTMLEAMTRDNDAIPQPSSLANVRHEVQAIRRQDELPYSDDTVYQLVSAPSLDQTPVRINISLPRAVLDEIDQRAKDLGFTRSGYLAHAAMMCKN
jgi:Uncharacterized conserved protein